MPKRAIISFIIVFIFLAGVWIARRPASIAPPVQPPPPAATNPAPSISVQQPIQPPATKQPAPPVTPKKITAPKKVPLPKPAAVPEPVSVMPMIPAPALQTRPTLPVMPVATEQSPQEWKGNSDTSIQRQGQIIVQNDEQWIHFWAEHHPDEAAPEVDFSRNMVVGVFLGLRPSDGFLVTIMDVRTLADKVVVDYIQLDPPPGTFQIGVSAYPYDIKVIPRTTLHITFNQLTPQYQRDTSLPPAKR